MRNGRLVILVGAIAAVCGGCDLGMAAQTVTTSSAQGADTPPTKLQSGGTPSTDTPRSSGRPPVVKVTVGKQPNYVNLIPKDLPPTPKFAALEKKPGVLRGYVTDPAGKPLKGASIGVRATLLGGRYSGASAQTDEKGYYEMKVPQGVAEVYAAGVTLDYAKGRAALPLHPADGKLSSFASTDGAVKHFVLWTYGVANKDRLSDNPRLSSNFYGGSLYIGHFTSDADDMNAPPSNLRTGTEIEITLTPVGKLLDGSVGKTFVVKKAVFSSGFSINNIPVGQYRLTAKQADGNPLKMKLNKPKGLTFGISPKETTEGSLLTLHPGGAKAAMTTPALGNWEAVEVYVEIPQGK